MSNSNFQLNNIVPWGRSYSEYMAMFALGEGYLENKKVLGCGDGPASFNAEATAKGMDVLSLDPLYKFSAKEIAQRIEDTRATVMSQVRENAGNFIWSTISSPDALETLRMQAMQRFLGDYQSSSSKDRYIFASLPVLPFEGEYFNIALVSHLLFLYSDHLDLEFHLASILELLRVAHEVRVFPLVDLAGNPSVHLQPLVEELVGRHFHYSITQVPYAFQKGANSMLILKKVPI